MRNTTTITLYVPVDRINDFDQLLIGEDINMTIYGQKMHSPTCYQVNVTLGTFSLIKHLVKNP